MRISPAAYEVAHGTVSYHQELQRKSEPHPGMARCVTWSTPPIMEEDIQKQIVYETRKLSPEYFVTHP